MLRDQDHAKSYIGEIFGSLPETISVDDGLLRRLPFFLRDRYTFECVKVLDHVFVLAHAERGSFLTPAQFMQDADRIRTFFDADVALVLPTAPPHVRQRLLRKGVAFIVPKTHLFLPFLIMDFRTKTRQPRESEAAPNGPLSWPAQVYLLHHLQRQSLGEMTLAQASKRLGYSVIALSRAIADLVAHQLGRIERVGARKRPTFPEYGTALWQRAFPYLRSPVLSVKAAHLDCPGAPRYIRAGSTALAGYSMLEDDRALTFAIPKRHWQRHLADGSVKELPCYEESGVRMELWAYDPALLADAGSGAVDRLSLYLSCKDTPDERVQSALAELIEGVRWSKE